MNNISKFIDHTLLAPAVALADIEKLCEEAVLHQFASVCIPPIYVENALKLLQGTGVMLGSVAGFPFGYSHMTTKVEETKRILDHGADEVDVVVNLTLVKNQDWKAVRSELDSLATVTSLQHQKVLKIILETALLTEEEIIQL